MAVIFTGAFTAYNPLPVAAGQFFNGGKTISGTLTVAGVPSRRLVRLYERVSGALIASTFSTAGTGAFSFTNLSNDYTYYVVGLDDEVVTYNAEVADYLVPE